MAKIKVDEANVTTTSNDVQVDATVPNADITTKQSITAEVEPDNYIIASQGYSAGVPGWVSSKVSEIIQDSIGNGITLADALDKIKTDLMSEIQLGVNQAISKIENSYVSKAELTTTLASELGANRSAILNDLQTYTTATESLASDMTALKASFGNDISADAINAFIGNVALTKATSQEAFAQTVNTLTANYNGLEPRLTSTETVVAGQFTEWDGTSTPKVGMYKIQDGSYWNYVGGTLGENNDGWIRTDKNALDAVNTLAMSTTVKINTLQNQIDKSITTWFYSYGTDANGNVKAPTLSDLPAKNWVAIDNANGNDAEKIKHLGDLVYDKDSGYAYRFAHEDINDTPDLGVIWTWVRITDVDVTKALAAASTAQDTADHKRNTFGGPTPPTAYNTAKGTYIDIGEGDLWIPSTDYIGTGTSSDPQYKKGELYVYSTYTPEGGTVSTLQWQPNTRYTDDQYAKDIEAGTRKIDLSQHIDSLGWNSSINNLNVEVNKAKYLAQTSTFYNSIESFDADNWTAANGHTKSIVTSNVFSGTQALKITTSTVDTDASGSVGGVYLEIPEQLALVFSGKTIRISAYVLTEDGCTAFRMAYSTADVGNSGWQEFTPSSSWSKYEFTYDVPSAVKGGTDFFGIQGDPSGTIIVDNVLISVAGQQTYFQGSAPDATKVSESDVWIDSSNHNAFHIFHNGAWTKATDDSALDNFLVATYSKDMLNISNQIDGVAVTYFQDSVPYNASTALAVHAGDVWYKTSDGTAYKFVYKTLDANGNEITPSEWQPITNTFLLNSLKEASKTKAAADRSIKNYTTTPSTPYYVGDTWMQGSSGDIYTCQTERLTGAFVQDDWIIASKYSAGVQDFYTLKDGLENGTKVFRLDNAKVGSKPLTTYVSDEMDKQVVVYSGTDHTTQTGMKVNDIYIEKTVDTTGAVPVDVINTYKYNGSSWVQIGNNNNITALADLADGKRTIFAGSITPENQGFTPLERDIWIPDIGVTDYLAGKIYTYKNGWHLASKEFVTIMFEDFENGTSNWTATTNNTITLETSDVYSGNNAVLITSTQTNSNSTSSGGHVGGVHTKVIDNGLVTAGTTVEVTVKAKQPSTNSSSQFAMSYSTNSVGNSFWRYFNLTTTWKTYAFTFNVPSNNVNEDYLGIWADTSASGKGVLIDNIKVKTLVDSSADTFANIVNPQVNLLKTQIDNKIEYYFQDYGTTTPYDTTGFPTGSFAIEDRQARNGDIIHFTNTTGTGANESYRYDSSSNTWIQIKDKDALKALSDAAKAQSTADGKLTRFYGTLTERDNETTMKRGDQWTDSATQETYVYDSTNKWVPLNKRQGQLYNAPLASPPTGASINDVWVITDRWYAEPYDNSNKKALTSESTYTDANGSKHKLKPAIEIYDGKNWVLQDYDSKESKQISWVGVASKLLYAPDGSLTGWQFEDGGGSPSEFKINAQKFKISDGKNSATPFSIDTTGTVPQVKFGGVVSFSNAVDTAGYKNSELSQDISNAATTANWSNVTGSGKPADNATKNRSDSDTDKHIVNTNYGINMIENSDWDDGLATVSKYSSNKDLQNANNLAVRAASSTDTWAPDDRGILEVRQGNPVGTTANLGIYLHKTGSGNTQGWVAVPGRKYAASCYVGAHRCTTKLFIVFRKADNSWISSVSSSSNVGHTGAANESKSTLLSCSGVAPAGTAYVQMVLYKSDTMSGQTSSFLFAHKPMLTEVNIDSLYDTTHPVPYMDPVETTKGSQIKADAAKNDAVSKASADATAKANQAKLDAIAAIPDYGVNIMNSLYSTFDDTNLPPVFYNSSSVFKVERKVGSPWAKFGSASLMTWTNDSDGYIYLGKSSADYNVSVPSNTDIIISAYVQVSTGSGRVQLYVRTNDGAHHGMSKTIPLYTWTRIHLRLNTGSNTSLVVRLDNDGHTDTNSAMGIDGVMVEVAKPGQTKPSVFVKPTVGLETTTGAQTKADNAKNDAITKASSDATIKANQAKEDAISEASKLAASVTGVLPAYSNSNKNTLTFADGVLSLQGGTDTTTGMVFKAFRVNLEPGESWNIQFSYKTDVDVSSGFYFRVYEYDADLPIGKTHISNDAANSDVKVVEDTRQAAGLVGGRENAGANTTYSLINATYYPTSTAKYASIVILNWSGMGTHRLDITGWKVTRNTTVQDVLDHPSTTIDGGKIITNTIRANQMYSNKLVNTGAYKTDGTIDSTKVTMEIDLAAGSIYIA